MHIAQVVTHGTGQVVQLPPEVKMESGAFAVLRMGDSVLLTPVPPPPPSPPASAARARFTAREPEPELCAEPRRMRA